MRRRTRRRWVVVAVVAAAAACGLSDAEQARIDRWLLCEDCLAGELDSVVALGSSAVGPLGVALEGPTDQRVANIRAQATAAYRQALQFVEPAGLGVTEPAYVAHFVANYVATYQARSAIALGRIGTAAARSVLVDAMQRDSLYRSDVRRAIGTALADTLLIAAGDSQVARPDSLVAIRPAVRVQSAIGASVLGVRVVFVVDSGGGTITDSVVFTDLTGNAAVGSWRLGPLPGYQALRAVALGRAVRIQATAVP